MRQPSPADTGSMCLAIMGYVDQACAMVASTKILPSEYFVHARTNQDDNNLTKVLELLQSSQIRRVLANQGLVDEIH
jgi:hypothetical protein